MYTAGYYSAVKKNEIVPFAATSVGLEVVILSGESQRKSSGRISNYNNCEQWYEKQAGAR